MKSAKETLLSADRPFVGLRPFGFGDHAYFFGREDQVFSLFRLLDRGRFIAVVGSSGSGKSSLVRAGLLPLLEQESEGVGGRKWRWIEMRPGDAPLENLAHPLAQLGQEDDSEDEALVQVREGRILRTLRRSSFGLANVLAGIESLKDHAVLIVVDQFEELFRYRHADAVGNAKWREEATHFVQTLLEGTRARGSQIHVLITMRSDFIGDCAQFYGLPEAVSATQFLVPSTTRDQREQIITAPIAQSGAAIDPILVERILNDVSDELDQLPVLQHCLMRLWEAARAKAVPPRLEMAHYEAIGRASGALSQHAEEIFAGLKAQETAVEQMFRAIAETDGDGRVIRRALRFARLLAETGVDERGLRMVCDRFRADDCSFLAPSLSAVPVLGEESPVDVGHEALLRRWGRISAPPAEDLAGAEAGWLAQEEQDGRKYRALLTLVGGKRGEGRVTLPADQAEEWLEWWNAQPRTQTWAERYGGHFARVRQLLDDSMGALGEERARTQRHAHFTKLVRMALLAGAIAITALGGFATVQWRQAVQAQKNVLRLRQASDEESKMMLDHMTRMLYTSVENFRLVPHTQNAMGNLLDLTSDFAGHYALWARAQAADQNHTIERLDVTSRTMTGYLSLVNGQASQAVSALDRVAPDLHDLQSKGDPAMDLLKAEFHYFRGTAERYSDLFERARYDYTRAVDIAHRVLNATGQTTLLSEAQSLTARSLRARVETDTGAYGVGGAPADLQRAIDDNRAYLAFFDKIDPDSRETTCNGLADIGTSKAENLLQIGQVQMAQQNYDGAAGNYRQYVEAQDAQRHCGTSDMLLPSITLATGRTSYARALIGQGNLAEAAAQLDAAGDFYEKEILPGAPNNAYILLSDSGVHLLRGSLYLKKSDAIHAKAEYTAALKIIEGLRERDENGRAWDDTFKARNGLALAAEAAGNKTEAAAQHQAAQDALARANAIRARENAKPYREDDLAQDSQR